MSLFEDFVNTELPRRSAFLTVEITGYDGDPNSVSAPAILSGAPKGTWYYRETPVGISYRKDDAGVWKKTDSGLITQEDMTAVVNYSTGVDPDPDVVFVRQSDLDDHGPVKHFMAFLDALPPLIKHTVTANLSEEDHYPRSVDTYAAWEVRGKFFVGGSLILNGGLPSTYISRDVSLEDLVPVSTQTGSYDPYMTFSGTPFASFDLHGWFAVFDTGQVTIIHDHDDSTLYFIDELSPTPSSVTVARPSTRLLNDDGLGAKQAGTSFFIWHGARNSSGYEVQINDLCIAPYGGNSLYCDETNVLVAHLLLDNTVGPSEGGTSLFLYGGNSVNNITCCSRLSTFGSIVPYFPIFMGGKATLLLYTAYFRDGRYGALVRYGKGEQFRCRGLIMDGVGTMSPRFQDRGSILVVGGQCRAYHLGNGKRNEIRNCTTYGLVLRDGGHVRGPYIPVLVFKNMSAPCVRLGNTGVLDLANYEDSSFLDGGGNTDVGIQIDGPGADVQMNSLSDVSGSAGDVRMGDGSVLSYPELSAYGPVTDFFHNVVNAEASPLLENDQITPSETTIQVAVSPGNSVTLYWGDEISESLIADGVLHTYQHTYSSGTYTVKIEGDVAGITQWFSYDQPFLSGDVKRFRILTGLTSLQLGSTSVSGDVGDLSGLTALTYLYLSATSVSGDIVGLSGLTSLTQLFLSATLVSGDIGDLSGLTSLTHLYLSNTTVSGDIGDLSGLTSLTDLRMQSTSISGDITVLGGLTGLTYIILGSTLVSGDIGDLSGLTSLVYLQLSSTSVYGDIVGLSGLTSLVHLYLSSTSISGDIGDLSGLTSLTNIQLGVSSVSGDIGDLSGLTGLIYIHLSNTSVFGNVGSLSGMTGLQYLYLQSTLVSGDIGDLSGLTSLVYLQLSYTSASGDIGDLSGLTGLTELYLQSTSVSGDIVGLSGLTGLTQLYLQSTSVSGDIGSLSGMTSLIDLRMHNTLVSGTIGDLSGLTSLLYLLLYETSLSYSPTILPPWAGNNIQLHSTGLDSTEVDDFLMDLADGVGANGIIQIAGTNASRTSASDAAKATLLAAGWSVTVNE